MYVYIYICIYKHVDPTLARLNKMHTQESRQLNCSVPWETSRTQRSRDRLRLRPSRDTRGLTARWMGEHKPTDKTHNLGGGHHLVKRSLRSHWRFEPDKTKKTILFWVHVEPDLHRIYIWRFSKMEVPQKAKIIQA